MDNCADKAAVLIIDNDHSGSFSFENEKYEVAENAGSLEVPVKRSRGARGRVEIPFKTIDGAAKAGKDYHHVEGTLQFADE